MIRQWVTLLGLALLLCYSCYTPNSEKSKQPNSTSMIEALYFPETGHTIKSPFLAYYLAHPNKALLGYPITEAFDHEGWRVQYFQNVRLEVHPENEPAYFITVGWLGQLSHRMKPPTSKMVDLLYFSKTGHTLSGDFLTYFEANGGTVQFGQPISEPFLLQGQVVQDFQSARLIWLPHLPPQANVQLEPLGETYFLNSALSLDLLKPLPRPPMAMVHQADSIILPKNAIATLVIMPTPSPAIIRIMATFWYNGRPLENYVPYLEWLQQRQKFPPSNSAGQTHLLVNISNLAPPIEFRLYATTGETFLISTLYPSLP